MTTTESRQKQGFICPSQQDNVQEYNSRETKQIILLVCKALNGPAPSYLFDSLPRYVPNRTLRFSSADLLDVPAMTYKKYGEAAFCFHGPTAWNKLPLHLQQAASVDIFKAQLKTHFFTLAFS